MTDDIKQQMERLKFGGKVQRVAEEDLAASFSELSEPNLMALSDRLYANYEKAGSPRNWRQWIKEQLEPMFICVDERPNWVGNTPMWAFLNDKPMVFIKQVNVGNGNVENSAIAPNVVLYLFGIRVVNEHGWSMEYRVLEDDPRTRGLKVAATFTEGR